MSVCAPEELAERLYPLFDGRGLSRSHPEAYHVAVATIRARDKQIEAALARKIGNNGPLTLAELTEFFAAHE